MVRFRNLSCVALLLLCLAVPVQAAYLTSWSTTPTVVDPNDLSVSSGQDIYTGVWHETDGTNDYFRIDLEAAPGSGNFAGGYGIWIDTGPGGAPADHEYAPGSPAGIDIILDLHYQPTLGYYKTDYHVWNGVDDFTVADIDAFQTTENGGATLEFQQNLGGATIVNWCAATYDLGSETGFYDIACTSVPEPSSIVLIVMGVLGLGLLRHSRK